MLDKLKKIYHWILAWGFYWYYGRPSRQLIVIGVTGTKGKSTTCRLIASVLEAAGHKVGMMNTVEFQVAEKHWPNNHKMSMLGRGFIHKMLKKMVDAGCRYAVVETSSQGILQYRHLGLNYDITVFTNLAPEHIESHGGFENLKRDKGQIFANLKKGFHKKLAGVAVPKIIIADTDDANAEYFLSFPADKKYSFGFVNYDLNRTDEHFIGKVTSEIDTGTEFEVDGRKYQLNIPGSFNVYNALAALAVGKSQGMNEDQIARGLASVHLVEGRMESVEAGQDFKVFVDYAHEPLSLTELFKALRKMLPSAENKVIAVVGSDGGGRDRGKRAKMGQIAGELTDYVVITDVNCFDEDPAEIAEMLAVGARAAGKKDGENLFVVVDRRAGIAKAVSLAKKGDIVVVTAKGTEPVLCIAKGVKIPWDDRKVTREILEKYSASWRK